MPRRVIRTESRSPRRLTQAWCDESAAHACLRRSLNCPADSLEVRWSSGVQIVLSVAGREILTGAWEVEVSAGDQPVQFSTAWECVLWHSDRDCDYLELQSSSPEGAVLERQILLGRRDAFAHMAVKTAGLPGPSVTVASRWTTSPTTTALDVRGSRELVLREQSPGSTVRRVRAFPLSLPQDRTLSTPGEFRLADGGLELRQTGPGTGLYLPLNLDWDERRRKAPADWRTLTVAEEGTALAPDAAAAHRLRIGLEHQVLVYHSLYPCPVGRSVLGHNTRRETVIGLFSDRGDVTPVMAVE